ncbi:MAG: TRC40/GET3/ArsA family transport-energizing ATPase [Gemmatimonadota bacterium]|nr:MAG: TRC40/GET3/ArsA family transport-energizing ATPase [Gemmatimonadota bacterium]
MDVVGEIRDREISFFGGKGGVGKTTLATAFALWSAEQGRKTLLISTDRAHSTSHILDATLGPEPRQVYDHCWAVEIDPEREATAFIDDVKLRIAESTAPRLVEEVERQIDIARVSPGAEEAALFERFARIIEEATDDFDRLVFDTAPTGQTLRLLSLPELMNTWISGLIDRRRKVNSLARMWRNVAGAAAGDNKKDDDPVVCALEERQARFRRVREFLTDASRTGFSFVITPERLPILETERAVSVLVKYGIPVGAIFVNRVIPNDVHGEFLNRRREREVVYLEHIARIFGSRPLFQVPLSDRDVIGVDALRRLSVSRWDRANRE